MKRENYIRSEKYLKNFRLFLKASFSIQITKKTILFKDSLYFEAKFVKKLENFFRIKIKTNFQFNLMKSLLKNLKDLEKLGKL